MGELPERVWAPSVDILALEVFASLARKKANSGQAYLRADTAIPKAEADAMVAAAWQAAAEAADALGMMWWAQYKYHKSPHCASTHREGMSDGAADVAKHIRQSTPSDARAAFEQAVREAVEAERERCAKIVAEYAPNSSFMEDALYHIRKNKETGE